MSIILERVNKLDGLQSSELIVKVQQKRKTINLIVDVDDCLLFVLCYK